ncbi:hypothetical protein BBM16_06080 [Vibrio parahaemolyticus]|nr:hypothetical protein BBM16_06080 [Vibrio parahaemolyticus]
MKQKIQPQKKPKNDFHKPKRLKIEIQNRAKNTRTLALNITLLLHLFSLATNAALRGEQRIPPKLNHCAVNTKADSNQNCQAL